MKLQKDSKIRKPVRVLTTVKVLEDSYEDFKLNSVRNKVTFTKLVDVALSLYNSDDKLLGQEFRKIVEENLINTNGK